MQLNNATIAITGAARGLGRAMAETLAQQGAKLALIDMDSQLLGEIAEQCAALGSPKLACYQVNISQEAEVETAFAQIAKDFGSLNGLVNNAGITRDGLLVKAKDGKVVKKMGLEQWQQVLDVNLTGSFLCAREAAVQMIETQSTGCIINISSISRAGNFGQSNYSAAKSGVEAMSVTWARELASYGIRTASIAPGFIATDMVKAMPEQALEKMARQIPAGRLGEAGEIASTVKFILENDYISGRCFEIDGGLRL